MKVLVTGACGFIGTYLCNKLKKDGHTVYCFDVADGDICKPDALDDFPEADIVYHLAARAFVPDSWTQTSEYFQTNIMGTVTVLEYCRRTKARLVFMSTYVYGEPQYLPVNENHPIRAVSPYHESKLLCEDLCRFYNEQFDVNAVIFRPFNVYGKKQNEQFLIPKIMKQILDSDCKEVAVFDLSPKRDYIYIHDLIGALVSASSCREGCWAVNIGTGRSYSVEEVITTAMAVLQIEKPYRQTGEVRSGEISDCYADISLASELFGYTPKYSLAEGLHEWVKN